MLQISYVSDGSPKLVFEGDVKASQIKHAFDAVVSGPEFARGAGLVVDATGLHHEYSEEEIRTLAMHMAAQRDSLGRHLAVVVSPDSKLQFGLARMFATYADIHELKVSVFTSLDEALRWLESVTEG